VKAGAGKSGEVRPDEPKAKLLESREMFDYSYLREIDQSGFIDALYR